MEKLDSGGSLGASALPVAGFALIVIFMVNQAISSAANNLTTSDLSGSGLLENTTWVFHRGTANIRWCEDVVAAHVYHDWIAEFFNTISNVTFVSVALLGLKRVADSRLTKQFEYPPLPTSFIVAELIMLVGVGFGSMMFHAHQSRIAQLADELPMSLLVAAMMHCMKGLHPLTTDSQNSKMLFRCSHATFALLWVVYLYTQIYEIFLLCFLLQIILAVTIGYDVGRRKKLSQRKWWLGVGCILGAKMVWNLERERFEQGSCDAPYTMWLHPLWHFGASLSHYLCMSGLADFYKSAPYEIQDEDLRKKID